MQLEIVSFDGDATINDGINYQSGFPRSASDPFRLVRAKGVGGERIGDFPLWALKELQGGTLAIEVTLLAPAPATLESQRDALAQLFDVYDTSGPKRLIVQNVADANRQWYCDVDPVDFHPEGGSPSCYVIILFAPDPQWREFVEQTSNWGIVATGATHNITVLGNRPTPIELRLTPTVSKGNDWAFEHLVHVRSPNDFELNQYPVDLTNGGWNTQAIIAATEMQADGDDLRVYVDGKEVDRWIADINTASTKVWINLDMRPRAYVYSSAAFNIGATTLTHTKGYRRGTFKRRNGFFRIDNEMVSYAIWDRANRQFTGCVRGIWGTTEANHGASTWVHWVEHHIKIVYGDAAIAAPSQDDEYRPAFDMSTSTNGEWRYTDFGDNESKRSGRWMHEAGGELKRLNAVNFYTGNQGVMADPWTEMGLVIIKDNPVAPGDYFDYWYFRAQVDITNTQFDGEYRMDHASDVIRLVLRAQVPDEKWQRVWFQDFTTNIVWTAWGPTIQAPPSGTRHLRLQITRITEGDASGDCYIEVDSVRLTFSGSQIPAVAGPTTWARIVNPYQNCPRITNTTIPPSGEYIELDFGQRLNEPLIVRSEDHAITYRNRDEYQALVGATSWERWLQAIPGVNTLRIDETGVAGVTIQVRWRGRNS